jgi:hypothetical protein
MLEQSLINPNFIGRDSFRWFTGIVTKYKNTENGYRAKVRIIGHHPDSSSIVKDEELPWAHVLVPLNFGAGEGGSGISFNPRGSEAVIGFFMDGDDGQQPVIIGALFSGASIEHPNTFDLGTNGFKPFQPGTQIINPSNQAADGTKTKDSGVPLATGRTPDNKESKKQAAHAEGTAPVVTTVPACKSGEDTVSKISQALRKFIYYLNTVQNYINIYVNPTLNYIQNIPALIQEIATVIGDGLSDFVKIVRDLIIEQIYQALKNVIERFLPKDAILIKKVATENIVDGIWCAFQNILKKIAGFVFDFLGQMIGKVITIPLCAVESLIGSMMQTITNEISDAIGPLLSELTSVLGESIGQISSYISQAVSYARTVLSFFTCDNAKCKNEFDYEMNKGFVPKGAVNFQRILSYSPAQGARNLLSDGSSQFSDWLGQNSGGNPSDDVLTSLGVTREQFAAYSTCDSTTLNCGLPKVTFFGGFGGNGGTGAVIVDVLGQVLGVNILDPGANYTVAPYVTFEDACNTGGGARGNVILRDGRIDSVYMTSNGYDYIGPGTNISPSDFTDDSYLCTTNPIGDDGLEYTAYVSDVIILNTGSGYTENDLIYNIYCDTGVEIYPVVDPDGRIVDTKIVNSGVIRTVPELAINTTIGSGAILVPVLKFVEVGIVPEDRVPLKQVILCADRQ